MPHEHTGLTKVEYRVRPHIRYSVTRYYEDHDGAGGGCEEIGEYSREEGAYDVAYAMCRAEHQRLGWPLGDERIQYPRSPSDANAVKED